MTSRQTNNPKKEHIVMKEAISSYEDEKDAGDIYLGDFEKQLEGIRLKLKVIWSWPLVQQDPVCRRIFMCIPKIIQVAGLSGLDEGLKLLQERVQELLENPEEDTLPTIPTEYSQPLFSNEESMRLNKSKRMFVKL